MAIRFTSAGDATRGTPKMFSEGKILGDKSRQDPLRIKICYNITYESA